jgi:S1-C subfamily serine protease
VTEIEEGSVAERLNLQKGDVILAINDEKVDSTRELERATGGRRYYWKITLARGGQVFTTVVGG